LGYLFSQTSHPVRVSQHVLIERFILVNALLNKSNFAELKDQITHLPDNADAVRGKAKVQNHQLVSPHQPWLHNFLAG
jgi:hypothetical protein